MRLQDETIAFMGAGNMGEALIRGLVSTRTVEPKRIIATDVRAERLRELGQAYGIRTTGENRQAVTEANVIVLAVKPQQMGDLLASVRTGFDPAKLVISIAAGIPTARIEHELGVRARVVRVMPNTPALLGAGAAGICAGTHATEKDLQLTEALLGAVGISVRVTEPLMDAVTALSGSGPAYVFYVTEALIRAGVTAGLPEQVARRLAMETIHGAAELLRESGDPPEVLRRKVTSPGGTTEAAIKVMTERGLSEIFAEAIQAAVRRGQELSRC